MKEFIARLRNTFLLILIMCSAFCISLLISNIFDNESLIPAIMMLAVFIISLVTKGYRYGVIASLISVLTANYPITFPCF